MRKAITILSSLAILAFGTNLSAQATGVQKAEHAVKKVAAIRWCAYAHHWGQFRRLDCAGNRTTASVVAMSKTGDRLVGQLARRQAVLNPINTVSSIKRFIGRRFDEVESEREMAASDRKVREEGDTRNEADQVCYQIEHQLNESFLLLLIIIARWLRRFGK
jgi:hypothetical protein